MKSERGFTFIEFLVVLLIAGILLAIAIPVLLPHKAHPQHVLQVHLKRVCPTGVYHLQAQGNNVVVRCK